MATTKKFSTQLKTLPLELKLEGIKTVAQSLELQGKIADATVANTLHNTLQAETNRYLAALNSQDALTKHKAYKTFCANSHAAIQQAKLQTKDLASYLKELNQIQLVIDKVATSLLGYRTTESVGRAPTSLYGNSGKATVATTHGHNAVLAAPEVKVS